MPRVLTVKLTGRLVPGDVEPLMGACLALQKMIHPNNQRVTVTIERIRYTAKEKLKILRLKKKFIVPVRTVNQ